MTNRWDQPGIPHREWRCIDVIDLCPEGESADNREYGTCEMCGKYPIRFLHVMEHSDVENHLNVGCVCAEKMSGDYVTPKASETTLRNKAARKVKWLTRRWRTSARGNDFLNTQGHNLVVFPNKYKPEMWSYRINGQFCRDSYDSKDEAKLALFEALWELTQD